MEPQAEENPDRDARKILGQLPFDDKTGNKRMDRTQR